MVQKFKISENMEVPQPQEALGLQGCHTSKIWFFFMVENRSAILYSTSLILHLPTYIHLPPKIVRKLGIFATFV